MAIDETALALALANGGVIIENRCGHVIERQALCECVSDSIGEPTHDRRMQELVRAVMTTGGDAVISALAADWVNEIVRLSAQRMYEGQQQGIRYEIKPDGQGGM